MFLTGEKCWYFLCFVQVKSLLPWLLWEQLQEFVIAVVLPISLPAYQAGFSSKDLFSRRNSYPKLQAGASGLGR
jgi:hypothetical protein